MSNVTRCRNSLNDKLETFSVVRTVPLANFVLLGIIYVDEGINADFEIVLSRCTLLVFRVLEIFASVRCKPSF